MAEEAAPYGEDGKGNARSLGQYWHDQIDQAEKDLRTKFWDRGAKIVRRYRDERDAIDTRRKKFNILWSNFNVLKPALYGRAAKPEVQRRHNDSDPVGRTAALMVERTLSYEVENYPDFGAAMNGAVEDRLLPGRGVSWVRYEPNIVRVPESEETAETAPAETGAQVTEDEENPPNERVQSARSPTDYVYWQDFLHNSARTWEEVWWVARAVYMTKTEGMARFKEIFDAVPIAYEATENQTTKKARHDSSDKKAKVYEIWNKRTGKVCWIAKGYPHHLDEKPDPLQLEGFFPCAKPLNATTTTDSIIPVADYCEYQDQAEELDTLTQRISMLVKACKAVGVFNAEHKSLLRLFNEGVDNQMLPVDSWAAFAEKGGLKGEVVFLDLTTIVAALQQLYESREQVKQTIYEVIGIGDIIRGATDPNETLGAQQLKANFGNMRLRTSQADVARYASDLFRLKAQIICRFYPPELIIEMSGIAQTADGKDPQIVEAAMQLLKNSTARDWRINVESDSLAQLDEQQEKAERMEFVTMLGTSLNQVREVVAGAPEIAPMVFEAIKFAARGFRVGKTFEAVIEQAEKAFMQKANNPQPAQQDPAVAKAQADAQKEAAKAQQQQTAEAAALQREQMAEAAKLERERIVSQETQAREAKEIEEKYAHERWKAELAADTSIIVAEIGAASREATAAAAPGEDGAAPAAKPKRRSPLAAIAEAQADFMAKITEQGEIMGQRQAELSEAIRSGMESMRGEMGAPIQFERDAQGRPVAVVKGGRRMPIQRGLDGRVSGVGMTQ